MGLVWIASYPKSGNTWVRLLFRAFAAARAGRPPDRLLAARGRWEASDADRRWFQPLLSKPIEDCSLAEIAAVRPRAQAAIAASEPADVFVKTHHRLGLDRGQPTINPAVTRAAVYVVRDPRDVAVSYRAYLGLDLDGVIEHMLNRQAITDRANGAYWALGDWGTHVESWSVSPPRGVVVLRYEDLLEDPAAAFRSVLATLNTRHTPGELRRAVKATDFARLRREEETTGFSETPSSAERFFREGRAGGWRDHLSAAQTARLTGAFGETMARFGYAA